MSVLHSDSPLMKLGKLSGVHEDAVRCIYDKQRALRETVIDNAEEKKLAIEV